MANIRAVCPELAAKARDELNEVESRIPEDLANLKEWIAKQPHLKPHDDDQFLLAFLRGCKYSLEKTKQKLDAYYTIRSLAPELFLDKRVDEKALRLAKHGPFLPLPRPLGIDGPRIQVTRYKSLDPNEFHITDICKHQLRIQEMELRDSDNLTIGGIVQIIDMSSVPVRFFLQADPSMMKKLGLFTEKALPMRFQGLHIVNVPKEAAAIINFIIRILSSKIKNRTVLHSSFDSLHEYVPKEYLPVEYGGTNCSIQEITDDWVQKITDRKQFFEDDWQYGVDESLRIGDPVTTESLFGLDGSFRLLQVD